MFMAMELLEGSDLKHAMAGRKLLSFAEKLGTMEQICEGLAFAHARDLVHRDLKPANIHILPGGKVKIMDFGLARTSGSDMTSTGTVMGTPHYMSPEQVKGLESRRALGRVRARLRVLRAPVRPASPSMPSRCTACCSRSCRTCSGAARGDRARAAARAGAGGGAGARQGPGRTLPVSRRVARGLLPRGRHGATAPSARNRRGRPPALPRARRFRRARPRAVAAVRARARPRGAAWCTRPPAPKTQPARDRRRGGHSRWWVSPPGPCAPSSPDRRKASPQPQVARLLADAIATRVQLAQRRLDAGDFTASRARRRERAQARPGERRCQSRARGGHSSG